MAHPSEKSAPTAGGDSARLPRADVDLQAEIEDLRDFIRQGRVYFDHAWGVDVREFEGRINEVLGLLPTEIRRARRITRDEQKIIQDARDEAQRILEEARAEAEQIVVSGREEQQRLVEQSAIRQKAQEQAAQITQRAEAAAQEMRANSHTYALQVIGNVEKSLQKLSESVQRDRSQLEALDPSRQE